MKLTFLLVCGIIFSVSATVRAQDQTVTLKMKNTSFGKVIVELKRQTQLDFFYSFDEVDVNRNVSISVANAPVDQVLREILGKRYTLEYMDNMVIIKPAPEQAVEKRTLRGKVKDTKGSPLPGVTVMLKGTGLGVVTDAEGNYLLRLPEAEDIHLLFSFVGMKTQEVVYAGQQEINVTLHEEQTQMDEVVVTGYQVVDRRKNTSAVTSVKAEDVMRPGVTSIDQMLEGQIPDLMFTSNSGEVGVVPKLRIRGTSTLIGNREPLWVIDGIVQQDPVNISPEELNNPDYINRIGNAIGGLKPEDIERLDV
ncbi:MAG: carboxypeptidase-like regulatory domain-containing protein, partial [Odoribacter sp.]|nr:carboxypeptidase-like regulatory domain-containing protein [Odoribacter sp.]